MTAEPAVIRPYGDTTGDGRVQLSFTLPVPYGSEEERALAEGAALQLAGKMGLHAAMVVHAKGMGSSFTFFVVYGTVTHLVDLSQVTVARREFPLLSAAEINLRIRSGLGRELVVVGASVGNDAHTVGIDAILNVKGHAGEKGLEHYREMRVINLGAQVPVPHLVARAQTEGADAVLISQVVTQREAHLSAAKEVASAFRAASPQPRPLLVVGGPRFDPSMAAQLGVDKIFGRGATPREVASYLVHALTPTPAATSARAAQSAPEPETPNSAAPDAGGAA
jgi:beta-lysine 5,6-aminomutase beta subunit